jgi:hypothetical protein
MVNKYECEDVEVTVDGRDFMIAGTIEVERGGGVDSAGFIDETLDEVRFVEIRYVEEHGQTVHLLNLTPEQRAAMVEAIEDRAQADAEAADEARADR